MSWFTRLRNAIAPRRLDEELRDEMADHLARRAASLREEGLGEDEARRQAELRFGNATQIREQSREIRLSSFLETMFQDLRYAWRGLRKSPVFALTAIGSLALAVGANTAIYSIVDAALLRPLPVPEPDRLFSLSTPGIQEPGRESLEERDSFNYPLYLKFRSAAGDSARLALFSNVGNQLTEVQIPDASAPIEKASRQFVSGEAFEILRVPPALGRVFTAEDDRIPWGHPVAVISYDYWTRRFHSDPLIVGKHIYVPPRGSFTIIGVAREGFFGVEPGRFIDVWLPAMMYSKAAFDNVGWNWFRIFGRLAPGATSEQLQPRLQPSLRDATAQWINQFPTMPPAIRNQFLEAQLRVRPGARGLSSFRDTFERPLWIVLAVAAGILSIACANIASLLLARATARSSEMAMRISLGASRSRLIRQLLTESLLLSILAAALGWALAVVAAPALVAMLSTRNQPVRFALAMDTRALLFCFAVSAVAAAFFGLIPAWQASGTRPMIELRGAASRSRLRLGRFFVSVQVAFAFCLVIAGSGFLFSLRNLLAVNPGFDPHNVSVFTIGVGGLSDMTQRPQLNVFLDEFQRRIAALPGIQSAATAQWALFDGAQIGLQVIIPGKQLPDREEILGSVSPGYFAALHTPFLAGRDFDQRDRDYANTGPRPAIINQALARAYFGGENPIGKIFQTPDDQNLVNHQVIGVVANSAFGSLRLAPQPIAYSVIRGTNRFALYVRSSLDLGSVVKMVDREAEAIGYRTRIQEITTLDTLIGDTLLREKLLAGLGGIFAFLGLLLAAIGLFGLLNYSVSRRTKEIGIRAALGARTPSLVMLVLNDMFGLIAAGLAAGLVCAIGLNVAVQSLLYGIRPADPGVIATAAAIFLAAAILAGALPARKAASIDPMTALRHE
ncbi:MAG TPA: ABC transporter permease [Bryobacteraceae bacterium]|nr:ABC transporter permease [Bryobacteraceae bacterium]